VVSGVVVVVVVMAWSPVWWSAENLAENIRLRGALGVAGSAGVAGSVAGEDGVGGGGGHGVVSRSDVGAILTRQGDDVNTYCRIFYSGM
jgi:hypothetical protein